MVIVTRPFVEETDAGFLVGTFGKAIYFDGNPKPGRIPEAGKKILEEKHAQLLEHFKTSSIYIATTDNDDQFLLGYVIFSEPTFLEFIYVKDEYREQGIAKMLASLKPWGTLVNQSNLTSIGKKILSQMQKPKENLLAKKQDTNLESDLDPVHGVNGSLAGLIKGGIPVLKAMFQSAILAGNNTAETQLDVDSSKQGRAPDAMYYTQAGLIVKHNKQVTIVPLANVLAVDVERSANYQHSGGLNATVAR